MQFLRHPRLLCYPVRSEDRDPLYGDLMFSPHHLVPLWRSEIVPTPSPPRRCFFFDLGAQYYRTQHLGWFIDSYLHRGVTFDRIIAWEIEEPAHWVQPGGLNETDESLAPTKAALVLDTYPLEIIDRLSYFNAPVTATVGHRYHPWRALRSLTTAEDFVVVKLECAPPAPAPAGSRPRWLPPPLAPAPAGSRPLLPPLLPPAFRPAPAHTR